MGSERASGQVIVGANIRRGDALDYLQITCAVPSCANGSCTWSTAQQGMSAGSSSWGDAHPAMLCQSDEAVSGIRGRVVAFTLPAPLRRTGFDYASDLEIECSQMTQAAVAGPSGQRFYPVAQAGSGTWHHPEGGFAYASPGVAPNVVQNYITPPISCRNGGYAASSISVGIANFLGQSDHPVVQAVSLFCSRLAPQPPPQPQAGTDFRVMVPGDPKWSDPNYAGVLGYFPDTWKVQSSCHGFIGDMGINTPGANTCGPGFWTSLVPGLPNSVPRQLGDVAVVFGHLAGQPFAYHSALYIGCGLYLQRNGSSNIQVSNQAFIDNFTTNEQVVYIRPLGSLATYQNELATLKPRLNPNEGPTPAYQNLITQIKNCFPN